MKKIYKYFSDETIALVFKRENFCSIKCSFPKNYNDPYELFLGVDLTIPSELLATYSDIVQSITQFPTTCFSNSPSVVPMWAHYARNHSGFVIEFDVQSIIDYSGNIRIKDVDYKDTPSSSIADHLFRAAGTKKPRHAMFLRNSVANEAYFSKHTCWSYERECRLVTDLDQCEEIAGNDILHIPMDCVSSIIVGSRASEDFVKTSMDVALRNNLRWYVSVIGKSQSQPFFKDQSERSFTFDGRAISDAKFTCELCSEPTADDQNFCPWCRVTEAERMTAAQGNPLRMLDHIGALDDYIRGFGELASKFKKPRS